MRVSFQPARKTVAGLGHKVGQPYRQIQQEALLRHRPGVAGQHFQQWGEIRLQAAAVPLGQVLVQALLGQNEQFDVAVRSRRFNALCALPPAR